MNPPEITAAAPTPCVMHSSEDAGYGFSPCCDDCKVYLFRDLCRRRIDPFALNLPSLGIQPVYPDRIPMEILQKDHIGRVLEIG